MHPNVCVITARRARHRRFHPPRSHARARCGGGARSIARSRARGVALAVEVAVGYIFARHARHTRHARRSSRARTRTSSPLRARHHRFPSPPCTTGTRALLRRRRSLDRPIARSRAHGVALAIEVAVGYTARHAREARARTCHHCASRASSPPPSPMSTMRARGVRLLAHLQLRTSPRAC